MIWRKSALSALLCCYSWLMLPGCFHPLLEFWPPIMRRSFNMTDSIFRTSRCASARACIWWSQSRWAVSWLDCKAWWRADNWQVGKLRRVSNEVTGALDKQPKTKSLPFCRPNGPTIASMWPSLPELECRLELLEWRQLREFCRLIGTIGTCYCSPGQSSQPTSNLPTALGGENVNRAF